MNFAQSVQEWQTFYATIAASAATLIGLLFVAVSLNMNTFNREENVHLKVLSRMTFESFIFIVVFALIFLIPEQTPYRLGSLITAIGCYGLFTLIRELWGILHHQQKSNFINILRRVGWRLLAFLTMTIFAIRIMLYSDTTGLYYMFFAMLFLLISATRNSWILLVGMGERPASR